MTRTAEERQFTFRVAELFATEFTTRRLDLEHQIGRVSVAQDVDPLDILEQVGKLVAAGMSPERAMGTIEHEEHA